MMPSASTTLSALALHVIRLPDVLYSATRSLGEVKTPPANTPPEVGAIAYTTPLHWGAHAVATPLVSATAPRNGREAPPMWLNAPPAYKAPFEIARDDTLPSQLAFHPLEATPTPRPTRASFGRVAPPIVLKRPPT